MTPAIVGDRHGSRPEREPARMRDSRDTDACRRLRAYRILDPWCVACEPPELPSIASARSAARTPGVVPDLLHIGPDQRLHPTGRS